MCKRCRALVTVTLLCLGPHTTFVAGQRTVEEDVDRQRPTITFLENNSPRTSDEPATPNGNTVDVSVGPNFSFTFNPSTVTILVGDTVRWTWAASNHTVTSGSPCSVDSAFCSPNDTDCPTAATSNVNSTYSHTFTQAGSCSYFCRIHCGFGMTGTVNVVAPFITVMSVARDQNGFTMSGQTTPNTTITIQSSPDLATQFQGGSPVQSNAAGAFTFIDGTASNVARFYRATYP